MGCLEYQAFLFPNMIRRRFSPPGGIPSTLGGTGRDPSWQGSSRTLKRQGSGPEPKPFHEFGPGVLGCTILVKAPRNTRT